MNMIGVIVYGALTLFCGAVVIGCVFATFSELGNRQWKSAGIALLCGLAFTLCAFGTYHRAEVRLERANAPDEVRR